MKPFRTTLLLLSLAAAPSCAMLASQNGDAPAAPGEVGLGFGIVVSRDNLTASVNRIGQDETVCKYTNIYDMIQGRCPGVQVTGKKILIRGISSVNCSTDPLILVNDVTMENIDWINPNDVKYIDILKDAAACTLYGVRGANGVIRITLK